MTVVARDAKNAASTESEYSGMMAISPATKRVETRYEIACTAMVSSASISSATRMAPNCAVVPAPIVAAIAMPATTGATMRTLRNADRKPVSASIPMLPSDE
ncbi:Uncharacterised protein [Mycobacteroides abscessus subsp. abscessus]|nr:Uncharacterised protein [Mycobacteroides abscessus subsp. abscessus]SLD15575.1 Uncharacterised protein [Mycobacteroides abscessus subsp. massiliense]